MKTVIYMEKQLANIHALFNEIVGDITEQEWLSRAAPGQNRLGFIIWHIPRTQDNVVQLWIRGGSEIFHQPAWSKWQTLRPFGAGIGITLAEADTVAEKVSLAEVLAYTAAVHQEILAWLHGISDADLDNVPDSAAHIASYPEYQTETYLEQMGGMLNQPMWNLLMRPCIGHIHRHLGELELAKAVLRAR